MTRYVIVGAGSAGAVLAARLTERQENEVTLLEAGPDYPADAAPASIAAISPLRVLTSSDDARFRWDDITARRTIAQSDIVLLRGRGVGGSSSVNGMLAVRPEPADLDQWAAAGCEGWDWQAMLPWFRHLETDLDFPSAPWHGEHGPFPVWRPPLDGWGQVELAAKNALLDLGHPWCDDHNAPGSTGVGPYAANVDFTADPNGKRVSTNSAYLDHARDRTNLTILDRSTAQQVVFDGRDAVGVMYHRDGATRVAEGDHIICSAGSPNTTALLMRSGLGAPDHLEAVGVPIVTELPGLGESVSDHPGLGIQIVYDNADVEPPSNGRHINCFARYSSNAPGCGDNDMAVLAGAHPDPLPDGRWASQIQVALWQPFSTGTIRLRTGDPFGPPDIEVGMLADARDLERMRAGFRHLLEIVAHPLVAELPGRRSYGRDAIVFEDLDELTSLDDDEVDDLLLANVYDTQHFVGGCAMGAPGDARAVVDPHCRVRGVRNLSVIDASIFPTCPRANTNLTTIAIAERMASLLD